MGNSTTLYRDLTTDEEVKAVMFALAQSVTKRMRKKGVFGKCVSIWIRNNKFSSFVKQSTLAEPTDLDGEIARSAFSLFEENYKWYYPIRAVGITVSDLSRQKKYEQADLYKSEEKYEKLEKLARIQDDLKIRFGDQCIKRCLLLKDTKLTDFTPHSISLSKNSDAAV